MYGLELMSRVRGGLSFVHDQAVRELRGEDEVADETLSSGRDREGRNVSDGYPSLEHWWELGYDKGIDIPGREPNVRSAQSNQNARFI